MTPPMTPAESQSKYHKKKMEERDPEYLKRRYELRISYYRKLRSDVLSNYGGKCACCGESEFDFLQIDHVNGGGNVHRKTVSTRQIYQFLRKNGYPKDDYQLLCANCNMAKERPNGCPHQRRK